MCTYMYSVKNDRLYCILSNGEVIKYHIFISVVVTELSVRCLNTGLEVQPLRDLGKISLVR